LAGAAVLLAATFVVVSLLPTPEQAAQPDGVEVVTIPLHDVVSVPPPPANAVLPPTLAAPAASDDVATTAGGDGARHADEGAYDTDEAGSSGDDDVADAPPPEARKPVRLALEPALKPAPTNAPAGTAVASTAAKPDEAPKPAPAESKPAPTPAPVQKPAAPGKTDAPHATPASPSSQRWYVQVGGFADIDNARKVLASLKSAGQPNLLAPVETGKGTIYRVRGGPYASEAAAQQALGTIKALGYPGSQIVNP
ncbi:MAG TPA: SPOR domain-containing protein, partial [Solimonas sp.]|nr:SPOR domain-containing protein [Solimonas sp.]